MGVDTKIEWAHHTFNPWVGCTPVSRACDFCYAEAWAKRTGHPELWQGQRRRTTVANWRQPIKWNDAAAAAGVQRRVFCASLADVFDNQVPDHWRSDLFALIEDTPNLDWLLLTKRPQNIARMVWPKWDAGLPSNIWLGTTAEDGDECRRRWPHLAAIPAAIRFISYEPALGPLGKLDQWRAGGPTPDWLICGGESGGRARPMDPAWARGARDQCAAAGVAFHFKQWGGRTPKAGGRLLDGREHNEFPEVTARKELKGDG
jgi:protein gp37